jgi:rfaE bifunctional protein nucleotidyltransferase chain/domain
MGQVIDRATLAAECARLRAAGERVVLTNGVFDLLHVGHLRSLQAARALGDRLVVGINDDASVRHYKGPLRPIVPAAERAELVAALACVDYAVIFGEATAEALVTLLQPAVYVKGGDYAAPGATGGKPLPEAAAVLAYGGTVHIVPLLPEASSTGLIERVLARYRAPDPDTDRDA